MDSLPTISLKTGLAWIVQNRSFKYFRNCSAIYFCYTSSNHCVKNVHSWSYSDPHFPAFGLNTERYVFEVILVRIGKKRTRTTPHTIPFHAVNSDSNAIANVNADAHVPIPRFPNGRINHWCITCVSEKLNKNFLMMTKCLRHFNCLIQCNSLAN